MTPRQSAIGRNARPYRPANHPCVRLAKATSDSITGTSTSTPTTVANAAPEFRPNRLIATATASSKKFEVPISAQGAAMLKGVFHSQAAP